MNRRKTLVSVVVLLMVALPVGLVGACYFWLGRPEFWLGPFYRNYQRIEVGMTLEQVETILGPGQKIHPGDVPTYRREVPPPGVKYEPPGPTVTAYRYPTKEVPVVEGDRFYRWLEHPDRPNSTSFIVVAFRDGKVSGKFYWSYSL
jgi:hypothetical protein